MLLEYFLLIVSGLIVYYIYDNYFPRKNYPPGPTRLPFIGNAIEILKDRHIVPPYIKYGQVSKRFGPICYVRLGFVEVVIIDEIEAAKQLLNQELWSDRPFNARIAERSFGKPLGIIFINGDAWKEMRRFSMKTLREFGYGKQSMQTVFDEEVKSLLGKLDQITSNAKDNGDEPILKVKHFLTMPVLNILWSLVSNVRTHEDDIKLQRLTVLVDNLAKANPVGGSVLAVFPILRHLFPKWTGFAFAKKCHHELQEYFRDILETRRKEGSQDDQRDFIDTFIQEIDRHEKLESNPNHYTDEQFITTITDLFEAGIETSSNTMEFAIYYMIKNPSIQAKVQDEIDRVMGHNRYPEIGDKNEMPYTEATLLEVQRMSSVLPLVVRAATEDGKLGRYDVNKGTFGVVNLYSIHMDPVYWGDPDVFRPERFLDSAQKIIPEVAGHVIPFGGGKRVCIGEQMARATLFIYFTALLQNYKFLDPSPHSGESNPKVDVGFSLSPKSYSTKIIKRI